MRCVKMRCNGLLDAVGFPRVVGDDEGALLCIRDKSVPKGRMGEREKSRD